MIIELCAALAAAAVLYPRLRRADTQRIERSGGFEVALRVVEGSQPGLAGGWKHGVVVPRPGALDFCGGGPLGFRWPKSSPQLITVVDVGSTPGRRPSLKQIWNIKPNLELCRIRTPHAVLDLAARKQALAVIVDRLGLTQGQQG